MSTILEVLPLFPGLDPTPTPTPTAGGSSLLISQRAANFGGLGVLVLAALVMGIVLALVVQGNQRGQKSLLSLPYMTWFVLHLTIAALGILAVAGLALAGVLGDTGTSALLGSLFGYVLGAAGNRPTTSSTASSAGANPTIDKLYPTYGPEAGGTSVVLSGANLPSDGTDVKVAFGDTAATGLFTVNANSLYVVTPQHAVGTVKVVVSDAKENVLSKNDLTFEYRTAS